MNKEIKIYLRLKGCFTYSTFPPNLRGKQAHIWLQQLWWEMWEEESDGGGFVSVQTRARTF